MFLYWGRRGLTQFALEAARAARSDPRMIATISVSRQNEDFRAFAEFDADLFPVDTFWTNSGVVGQAWRIPVLRQRLYQRLQQDRTQVVVDLLPHVWSPFIAPVIRAAGVRYVVLIHDADAHPGDHRTVSVKILLDRTMRDADQILTLSHAVSDRLVAKGRATNEKIRTLVHPDLTFGTPNPPVTFKAGAPIRLAFIGRVMPYKGLPLFLDSMDLLENAGVATKVSVYGEGNLGASAARLSKMGADVLNRWLTAAEIAALLARCDAVVLAHTEASQSGIAAMALAAGVPVVTTPVGGLREQIEHGVTGIVAERADAPSLAAGITRLFSDPVLYRSICTGIAAGRASRSMARFVSACVGHALDTS